MGKRALFSLLLLLLLPLVTGAAEKVKKDFVASSPVLGEDQSCKPAPLNLLE
jgi:hypothetical protein